MFDSYGVCKVFNAKNVATIDFMKVRVHNIIIKESEMKNKASTAKLSAKYKESKCLEEQRRDVYEKGRKAML